MPAGSWIERQEQLASIARSQMFFVGGAPRSGTTWLQSLLDSHPDVSCQGEGLFQKALAEPLDDLMTARSAALEAKNRTVFRDTGGYKLPGREDGEHLLGTAILLALARQMGDRHCKAVGEKTPENVFFFDRLKRLFPTAKFVGIARDPRDVLTSAWHFFHKGAADEDEVATKIAFIRSALPSLNQGARTMLDAAKRYGDDYCIVTYEMMTANPGSAAGSLFRFLGVSHDSAIVDDCVNRTSFATASGGRAVSSGGAFFRKGIVGDWRSTLSPEMGGIILDALGWTFPAFGWTA